MSNLKSMAKNLTKYGIFLLALSIFSTVFFTHKAKADDNYVCYTRVFQVGPEVPLGGEVYRTYTFQLWGNQNAEWPSALTANWLERSTNGGSQTAHCSDDWDKGTGSGFIDLIDPTLFGRSVAGINMYPSRAYLGYPRNIATAPTNNCFPPPTAPVPTASLDPFSISQCTSQYWAAAINDAGSAYINGNMVFCEGMGWEQSPCNTDLLSYAVSKLPQTDIAGGGGWLMTSVFCQPPFDTSNQGCSGSNSVTNAANTAFVGIGKQYNGYNTALPSDGLGVLVSGLMNPINVLGYNGVSSFNLVMHGANFIDNSVSGPPAFGQADGIFSTINLTFVYPAAPPQAIVEGRVWQDDNGNGSKEASEPYIQWPANSCGMAYTNLGVLINFDGSYVANVNQCNVAAPTDPYYSFATSSFGNHAVSVSAPPPGWTVTTANPNVINIQPGKVYDVWFGIRPPQPAPPTVSGTVSCTNINVNLSYPLGGPVTYRLRFYIGGVNVVTSNDYTANPTDNHDPFKDINGLMPFNRYDVFVDANNFGAPTTTLSGIGTFGPCMNIACVTPAASGYVIGAPKNDVPYGFSIINLTSITLNPLSVTVSLAAGSAAAMAPPSVSASGSIGPFASGTISTLPTITATGDFLVAMILRYNGVTVPAGSTTCGSSCTVVGFSGCLPETSAFEPYLKVFGGDVRSRPCNPPGTGTIEAFADSSLKTGSSVQYAAFAASTISGFFSASLRSGAPVPLKGLTFANTDPALAFGGNFGDNSCFVDYFATSAGRTPTGGTAISFSPADPIRLYAGASGYHIGIAGGPANQNINNQFVTYVEGDVTIYDNIRYLPAAHTINNLPGFALVASGNIYIDKGVTELSGLYYAGGTINTCSDGSANIGSAAQYMACQGQLTVNGELMSAKIKFARTNGNVTTGTYPEPVGSALSAERVIFGTEMWLANPLQPILSTPPGGFGGYDSITALPPLV